MAKRITETLVKALSSPTKGHHITYDTDLKGFGIRSTAGGSKLFILNYRIQGRERRYTIGSYPDWSAAAARKQAEDLKRRIDVGYDPMAERLEERSAPTVGDLCALYEEHHLHKKRPSSQRDDLGACPSSHCSSDRESDSFCVHEQAFSPLEDRSDAAAAAERAGLRA